QMAGMDGNFNDPMNGQFGDPNQMMGGQMPGMDGNFNDPMNGQFGDPNQMMGGQMPGMDGNFNDPMNGQFGDQNQMMGGQMPGMDGNINDPMNGQFGDPNQMMGGQMGGNQQSYGATDSDGDLGFVRNWMGNLYDKAHSSKFNWSAAFFNGAYLMYRKMFTTGIILLVLQTVIIVIGALVSAKSLVAGSIISMLLGIGLFVGMGLGFYPLYRSFVKGKLNSLRGQVNDQQQLMSIAEQKGGTSVLGVVIYCVAGGILTTTVTSLLAGSAISGIFGGGSSVPPNTTDDNNVAINEIVENPVDDTSKFNFDENYYLSYGSDWFLEEDNNQLKKGEYVLQFYDKYTKEQTNMDLATADGRKQLLDYLVNTLTVQATQANYQFSTGNENFIPQNDGKVYYNYIDFTSTNIVQRMYFIVLPEDNVLFWFVLTINDTSIDTTTNTSVVEMLTSIEKGGVGGQSAFSTTEDGTEDDENQEQNDSNNQNNGETSSTQTNANSENQNSGATNQQTQQSQQQQQQQTQQQPQQTQQTTVAPLSQAIQ
ncbi:MAG: DUF2628 domain-containing protein, partial [Clostridia bacterium]|nr:DUF2628 domain-containing protein [Clostridia bacterium]